MKEDFITTNDRIPFERQDLYAIGQLSQETRRPLEEVKKIYGDVLARLRSGARIHDFLILLTSKKVRGMLRNKENSDVRLFLQPLV